MITFGLSTWSIHRGLAARPLGLLDVPRRLREHGLTDLQVCEFQLPSSDAAFVRELRRQIDANDVTLDAVLIDRVDVAHPTRGEADAAAAESWLRVAADLGARHARVSAGDQPPTDDAMRRSAERMLRLADAGARLGVRVVTENWQSLLPDAAAVLRYSKLTEHRVPLCLDFGNWRGPTKYDELAAIAPHAVTVHAKCSFADDGAPDAADFTRCFDVLREAKFAGTIALIYDAAPTDEWAMLDVERDLAIAALVARPVDGQANRIA